MEGDFVAKDSGQCLAELGSDHPVNTFSGHQQAHLDLPIVYPDVVHHNLVEVRILLHEVVYPRNHLTVVDVGVNLGSDILLLQRP